jgi:hypothetical protein
LKNINRPWPPDIYKIHVFISSHCLQNPIGDAMISVLVSGAVDRGFELRSDQTKDYKIGM